MKKSEYLSVSAFAERYGKSRPTVYKLIKTGMLHTVQTGKRLKIDVSDPSIILEALHSLPGTGNYSGRASGNNPSKSKNVHDSEFDLNFAIFEKEEAERRLKRRLARIKRSKL